MLHDPGSPAAWMRYARSDLALARKRDDGEVLLETLCFHAQQAVEKSVKAVLVHFGVDFPRVHSIERLVDLLPPEITRTPELLAAADLSDYATVFRYPGSEEPVSEREYRDAVRLAEAAVRWAEALLAAPDDRLP